MPATPRERTRTRKPAAKKADIVTPEDINAIASWLGSEVLIERGPDLRIILRGSLAGVNTHLIGRPGLAKSLTIRQLMKCIDGAKYFEKVLHGTTPADAVIGGYDMQRFAQGEGLIRKVEGYMPWADFFFLDELPRANGALLDSTLPMMNVGERLAEHNGGMKQAPTMAGFTASNTWFDPDNTQHQALADRVTLMVEVQDLKADQSFKDMLRRDHVRRQAEGKGDERGRPHVTVEGFRAAQEQIKAIELGPEFLDKYAELRRNAAVKGLHVSPRRWVELGLVCRVLAWMSGRSQTLPDDLVAVEDGMWRDPQDRPVATELVQEFHGRFVRAANEHRAEAAEHLARLEQIKPQVESTPPNQSIDPTVLKEAVTASRLIDAVKARVDAVISEAENEKREAPELRVLGDELLGAQKWFFDNGLPTALIRR